MPSLLVLELAWRSGADWGSRPASLLWPLLGGNVGVVHARRSTWRVIPSRTQDPLAALNSAGALLSFPSSKWCSSNDVPGQELAWEGAGHTRGFSDKRTPSVGAAMLIPVALGMWPPEDRAHTPPPEDRRSALRDGVVAKLNLWQSLHRVWRALWGRFMPCFFILSI